MAGTGAFDAARDPGMQTPVAPLPAPELEEAAPPRAPAPPGSVRSALRLAARYVLRAWRPLLLVLLVQLLLALTVVLPFQSRLAERLDEHARAPELARTLDGGIWRDVQRLEEAVFAGLSVTLFWVVLVAWLFGAFAAGGFLGTAVDAHQAPSAGRFATQGGRYLGRMLRVGLVFLLLVWVAGRLVLELWAVAAEPAERDAPTAGAAFWGARLREGVFLLAFLWLRVAADLARADLVVFARRSAVAAFARGAWQTLRHPVRTLGLALAIGAPAFLALVLLGVLLGVAEGAGSTWPFLLAAFLVVQLAVLVRWAARAGLLTAFAHVLAPRAKAG